MKTILLGEKDSALSYDFRETCFGICLKDNQLLVTYDYQQNHYSLIGGGKEENESREETLKREFLEEVGVTIKDIQYFLSIDCFWLAGENHPMESLAHFYSMDIDKVQSNECEGTYEFIPIESLELPLPYQRKAVELYLKEKK